MEYRLLLGGGEHLLPFARSCITKLKKLGLPYANQSFEIDGVSVKVRIEPGHEYIRIEGGKVGLSGVIKDGEVTGKVNTFKPTQNCWEEVMREKPTGADQFTGSAKLAKSPAKNQYGTLTASSFSGLLAGAVQAMLGLGIKVKYKSSFAKSHGLLRLENDKLWLIEISEDNGVIAMPFKLNPGDELSKIDLIRDITTLLGGVPKGVMFPVEAADLNAAIENGKVVRLASAAALAEVYEKTPYAPYLGWSFNSTGTEAHATCYKRSPCAPGDLVYIDLGSYQNTGERTEDQIDAYHYKLTISQDDAVLSEVSTGRLIAGGSYGDPYIVFRDNAGGSVAPPCQSFKLGAPSAQSTDYVTVLVTHHADELILTRFTPPMPWVGYTYERFRRIVSGDLPDLVPVGVKDTEYLIGAKSTIYPRVVLYPRREVYIHSEYCRDAVTHYEYSEGNVMRFDFQAGGDDFGEFASYPGVRTRYWVYYITQQPSETEVELGYLDDVSELVWAVQDNPNPGSPSDGTGGGNIWEIYTVQWPDGRVAKYGTYLQKQWEERIAAWLSGFVITPWPDDSINYIFGPPFSLVCSMLGPVVGQGELPMSLFDQKVIVSGADTDGAEDAQKFVNFIGSVGAPTPPAAP